MSTHVPEQLKITESYIPEGSSNRPGHTIRPEYITIHNTGNTGEGANAAAHARYLLGDDARRRQVSWHFTVDDKEIFQHLPVHEKGWHAGRGNSKSVGIEICMHDGIDQESANEKAALLVCKLIKDLHLEGECVVQHQHWTGKRCPATLLGENWLNFITLVHDLMEGSGPRSRSLARITPDLHDSCGISDIAMDEI